MKSESKRAQRCMKCDKIIGQYRENKSGLCYIHLREERRLKRRTDKK